VLNKLFWGILLICAMMVCGSWKNLQPSTSKKSLPNGTENNIDLSGKRLKNIPDFVFQKPDLKKLNLRRNKLSSLPSDLRKLTQLETLLLGKNKFTSFPQSILDLQNLKYLSLSGNRIENIPAGISAMKSLEVLDLFDTYVSSLPIDALKELPNLKEIDLRQSLLFDDKAVALKTALPHVKIKTMPGCDCNAQKKIRPR
jgi:Leucine-rich repeat (LRR) protein